jgi:DNA repair exonuclease SbcCD ATPase subunit
MPLEKITLRNFQAHESFVIEFDPAATTIQGPSDRGKSAVVRALKWVAFNRPAGDAYKTRGADSMSVVVQIDGATIRRRKGKSTNEYKLDNQRFAAMGGSVPPKIAAVLNLSPANFQSQFDTPYWLSDSAGEVSKRLNAIVDLGVIDGTLATVAAAARKAGAELDVARGRRDTARAERDRLAWVPGCLGKLRSLEALESKIVRKRQDCAQIDALIAGVETAERTARNAGNAKSIGRVAVAAGAAWADSAKRLESLARLLDQIETARGDRDQYQAELHAAEREFRTKTKGQKCPVCGSQIR